MCRRDYLVSWPPRVYVPGLGCGEPPRECGRGYGGLREFEPSQGCEPVSGSIFYMINSSLYVQSAREDSHF